MPIGSTTRPASPAPPSTGLGVGLLSAFVTPPDAGGLLVDSAGGRTATVANGPLGTSSAPLPGGAGWTFNGTNQHAPFSDTGLPGGNQPWSAALLYRPDSGGNRLCLGWGSMNGPVGGLGAVDGHSLGATGGFARWTYYANGVSGATPVADGLWHLALATYDGSAVQLYVDGVADAAPLAVTLGLAPGNGDMGQLVGLYYAVDLAAAYIWGRCLAGSDATALAADVWAPVRPDIVTFKPYFLAPSPALGSGVY